MDKEEMIRKYRLNEIESLLEKCEDDISEQIEKQDLREGRDNINFLLHTVGKSFVSTREIVTLCKEGFPDGALSIARNVYEQFIIVAYIEGQIDKDYFDKMIERYNADYTLQCLKGKKYWAEFIKKDEKILKKYTEERADIKKKYNIENKSGNYWWTEEKVGNFSKLQDYVENNCACMEPLLKIMHLLYLRACLSLHSSCMGNKIRLGDNLPGISMGPWEEGQEVSLFLVTASLIYILGATYTILKIDYKRATDTLNELANFYYEIIKKRSEDHDI